jgi:hypothetical protein
MAGDGSLGATSTGRAEISITVPETIQPREVSSQDGKIYSCVAASPGLDYGGAEVANVQVEGCKGLVFEVRGKEGEAAVFVPSWG